MDTADNIRAFIAVGRLGSFSAAARHLGVAPSVITKRIGRLEDQMKLKLFVRSTRRVELTDAGQRFLPRYVDLLRTLEETLRGDDTMSQGFAGRLRVKVTHIFDTGHLAEIIGAFQLQHPNLTLDIVALDRSLDPAEEGFDLAISAFSTSYLNVHDEPICAAPRVCCAAPQYLRKAGEPHHPRDLIDHDCLTYQAIGTTWSFLTQSGPMNIEVRSKFSANTPYLLHDMCVRGHGITTLARDLVARAMAEGRLVEILGDYPVPEVWLKAQVPLHRMQGPAVRALLAWLKEHVDPVLMWRQQG